MTMNRLFVVPALAGPARDRLKAGLQTKDSSWRESARRFTPFPSIVAVPTRR
jgi:hypothetical protein